MAKETREVTQYKIYTLVQIVETPREGYPPMSDAEPVAVFDDIELAQAYQMAAAFDKSTLSEDWRELEPVAEHFSLPFNPVYVAPAPVEAAEAAQITSDANAEEK